MAKKKSSSSNGLSWAKISGFMAFTALIISGINAILSLLDGDFGIVTKIGYIFLVGSVFISAWFFVCSTKLPGKKMYWQIAIIVIAVLSIVGVHSIA